MASPLLIQFRTPKREKKIEGTGAAWPRPTLGVNEFGDGDFTHPQAGFTATPPA